MGQGRIVVITGAPGTGKSTTSAIIAKESDMEKSVHMYTDDFYHYLSKGAIAPHLPESKEQNLIVIEAFLEAAKRYARGGYGVVVDGMIGPWFLEPWRNIAQEGYEVHYLILRASKEETMKRAVGRAKLDRQTNIELVEATVAAIKEKIASKTAVLLGQFLSKGICKVQEESFHYMLKAIKEREMYGKQLLACGVLWKQRFIEFKKSTGIPISCPGLKGQCVRNGDGRAVRE